MDHRKVMVITKTEHKVLRFANEERNFSCIYSCTGQTMVAWLKNELWPQTKTEKLFRKETLQIIAH